MNTARLALANEIVPPLLASFHKGQAGRVAIVGGCEDYTGAPFFAAHAATLLGADMAHVICEKSAGAVIKSYSPNLMVHPYLYDGSSKPETATIQSIIARCLPLLDRIHTLVVGPGLGRDPFLQSLAAEIIREARRRGMYLVLDADALFLLQSCPELVTGYHKAVLTPNIVEARRLAGTHNLKFDSLDTKGQARVLARLFKGPTVLVKGQADAIASPIVETVWENTCQGGRKRVSGQGDTLSGCLGTFLAWALMYDRKSWNHSGFVRADELTLAAAYGASFVTRTASRLAFARHGRATLTSDISSFVGEAYSTMRKEKEEFVETEN